MGAVHDDVAVHQFGVPLDHTPEVVWERGGGERVRHTFNPSGWGSQQ